MIELQSDAKLRVVTKWRYTNNGPWIGVHLSRLGDIHWSARKIKLRNRNWVKDEHGQVIFKDWPSAHPMFPTPPPNTLPPTRIGHIHKDILTHISESKREW